MLAGITRWATARTKTPCRNGQGCAARTRALLHLERLVNLPVAENLPNNYACFRARAPRSEFWWFTFLPAGLHGLDLCRNMPCEVFQLGTPCRCLPTARVCVVFAVAGHYEYAACMIADTAATGWRCMPCWFIGAFLCLAILIGFADSLPGDLGNLPLVICLLMADVWFFISDDPLYDVYLHSTTARRAGHIACLSQKGTAGPNRPQPIRWRANRDGGRGAGLPDGLKPARRVRRKGGRPVRA